MWVGPTAVSAAGPLLQRSGGTLRAGFGQSFSRGQLTHHHHRHLISSENLTPAIQSPDNPPSRALRQSRLCVALEWRPASQGGNCSNGGTTKPSFRIPAGAGDPLREGRGRSLARGHPLPPPHTGYPTSSSLDPLKTSHFKLSHQPVAIWPDCALILTTHDPPPKIESVPILKTVPF